MELTMSFKEGLAFWRDSVYGKWPVAFQGRGRYLIMRRPLRRPDGTWTFSVELAGD